MAAIAVQDARAGLASASFGACNAGGDTVVAGMRAGGWALGVMLIVRNADAAPKTVTVQGTPYICPATTGVSVIPVGQVYANQPVPITYSAVTSLTIAAVSASDIQG